MGVVTRWWWIRHAPVTMNQGCCYGQTDFPCDVADRAAFAALASRLPEDAIWIASPLQRTHMTAAALVEAGAQGPAPIPGPALHIEPDLIEQNFGDWQGLKYSDLYARRGDEARRFWLAPAHETPPGGESFAALTRRVHRGIERLNERHRGRELVSISHGGTIRAALSLALGLGPEAALTFAVDTLSLTRIEYFPEPIAAHGWRVVAVNQPPHG
ncbi:MAG TPA: histidine phosphatase family protein [Stellaceae bacterium]|nr:histidine phosphatase family protein [Stellaceae bacterium]